MNVLLSGLIGAIIATLLSVLYQHLFSLANERRQLFVEVVSWLDNFEELLRGLQVQKDVVYEQLKKQYLSDDEYKTMSRELNRILLSGNMEARAYLAYGPSSEFQMVKSLREKYLSVARILWAAKNSDWQAKRQDISNLFTKEIEPQKGKIMYVLCEGAKWDNILLYIAKENIPSVYGACLFLKNVGLKMIGRINGLLGKHLRVG